jgi:chitinase
MFTRMQQRAAYGMTVVLAAAFCGCTARSTPPAAAMAPAVQASVEATPQASAHPRLVAYLFAEKGTNYTALAKKIRFGKITDLYLSFATPPKCDGVCTGASDMHFSIQGESGADIDRMVRAAHTVGVHVVASVGGGGGDQRIIQFYNAGLSAPLVASLDQLVRQHDLDGVDLDIEDPSNMGFPYLTFTTALTSTFHPEGKLVTAAVAKYLQGSMPDAALRQFDLLNIMNYSSYSSAVAALTYYAVDEKIAPSKLVLGVPFFGSNDDDSKEEGYKTILAAYPNAWRRDLAAGGTLDNGDTFHYIGEATMARETQLGKRYGGVMLWDLTDDAPAPHSLMQVIEQNF